MHWSTAADQPKSYESCLTVVTLIEGCPRKRNSAKQALSGDAAPVVCICANDERDQEDETKAGIGNEGERIEARHAPACCVLRLRITRPTGRRHRPRPRLVHLALVPRPPC